MIKRIRKWTGGIVAAFVAVCILTLSFVIAEEMESDSGLSKSVPELMIQSEAAPDAVTEQLEVFSQWNEDALALHTLIEYVEAVTDEASPDYIPPENRISTFDLDGTLMGELAPIYLEINVNHLGKSAQ